jgi:hypothetical protein
MGICLPYSKSKRYLTGMDWMICVLHHMTRRITGSGNTSQVVLELNRPVSEDVLRESLGRVATALPVLRGRIARSFNLAPYWRIPSAAGAGALRCETHSPGGGTPDALACLERFANAPLAGEREHLAFCLVNAAESRSFLAMKFDHRLLDARGAELFLDLFQNHAARRDFTGIADSIALTEPAHLSDWKNKFLAGQRVNRALLALADASEKVLPGSRRTEQGFAFRLMAFTDAESREIEEASAREAGYLMIMPWLLAVVVESLHAVFARKGLARPHYVVSVAVDRRKPDRLKQDLFFNHVSFLFFRVASADAATRPRLLQSVKNQMYEQSKAGLLQDLEEAGMLMRIVPLPWLSRLALWPLKGQLGSFAFGFVGESGFHADRFLGAEVLNVFHMPRPPVPPGIGVFFNRFRGRYNVALSCLHGLLDDAELDAVEAAMRKALAPLARA